MHDRGAKALRIHSWCLGQVPCLQHGSQDPTLQSAWHSQASSTGSLDCNEATITSCLSKNPPHNTQKIGGSRQRAHRREVAAATSDTEEEMHNGVLIFVPAKPRTIPWRLHLPETNPSRHRPDGNTVLPHHPRAPGRLPQTQSQRALRKLILEEAKLKHQSATDSRTGCP